ncbi:hypothetical protein SLEP1_g16297 [Rubroshorea leprosula]|uniref:UspA domain-containing protein n=1 Tax=Rubroshorea leprosula TaxID=152421 RepID=A0AAV5J119_9ROSI|nr:hypothetical protein SLEP1_g16297 [Rubroshorea leprosula]
MGKARTVGIGMDYSPTCISALRWAAENLAENGDRIILTHVQPPRADHTRKELFENTGSPLVPLEEFREINFSKQYGLKYDPEGDKTPEGSLAAQPRQFSVTPSEAMVN